MEEKPEEPQANHCRVWIDEDGTVWRQHYRNPDDEPTQRREP